MKKKNTEKQMKKFNKFVMDQKKDAQAHYYEMRSYGIDHAAALASVVHLTFVRATAARAL